MAENFSGYTGKLLRVDLTTGTITDERLDGTTIKDYVGGSGFGAKILYDEVPPEVEWSNPANRLIICSGPLGGTRVAGSGTFSAVTKGPLTNGAVTTQANGFLGAYLRFAGYDGIILQGAASSLKYLYIGKGSIELRDATRLAGKDTWETQDALCNELGKTERNLSVFGIGPAGETLVKFAAIAGDKGHVAGHNGSGAVMGSKRLKAIAIERSEGRVPMHDGNELSRLAREISDLLKTDPSFDVPLWGTSMAFAPLSMIGALPVRNYTTNIFPEWESFMGDRLRSTYECTPKPCWGCQMNHCHLMKVTEGPYAGYVGDEPEYEQWSAWGPMIGNPDPGAALMLANEVDKLGMDTNEAGLVVGWVMECYARGFLSAKDLDGLEMRWGNVKGTKELLRRIANRQGFGGLLAEGVKRAAEKIGGEALECAIYTHKGNSPRGHDHRALWSEMFETCVSNTGTIEVARTVFPSELGLSGPIDRFSGKDVSTAAAKTNGRMVFEDTLGTCRFCTQVPLAKLSQVLNAATGWEFGAEECLLVGRRVVNLLRVFNIRNGITAEQEIPSARYGSTPTDGPAAGISIAPHWDDMRRDYYDLMAWEKETAKPLPERLRRYG